MNKCSWRNALRGIKCVLLICAAIGLTGINTAAAQSNLAAGNPVAGNPVAGDPGAALRAKYASLEQALRQNQFKQPLVLDSTETQKRVTGDVYAGRRLSVRCGGNRLE